MHQSIPAVSSPSPPPRPSGVSIFFFCLRWQIPGGGDKKKRANAPSSVNVATFFIDLFDFLVQLTSSFVIVL